MKTISFRLQPGELLKERIMEQAKDIQAGVLLSIVGGVENAILRMAGSDVDNQKVKEWEGPFEIVSGTGTFSSDGCHIHVSLSDAKGNVIGGHLRDGCRVKYTAEIVIGILESTKFHRIPDKKTGFPELIIE